MTIKLTEQYRPYSHEVGSSCLLPKSSWKVQAFPTRIEFTNFISEARQETFSIAYAIQGPLRQFTMMQDLERHWVRIFGQGPQGYFSFRVLASAYEIILFVERAPIDGIAFTHKEKVHILKRKEELIIPSTASSFPNLCVEKMHFGSHKAQDWTLVKRRLSLQEILPIWFALGKHIPHHPKIEVGNSRLLAQCTMMVCQERKKEIGRALLDLFRIGFEGIFLPRLQDRDHHGLFPDSDRIPQEASSLMLLGEGARLIRQLLVQQTEEMVTILPCLPVELHAGRFIDVNCRDIVLNFEWSKKLIRRLIIYSKVNQTFLIKFQSAIRSFRIRKGSRDRGIIHHSNEPLTFCAESTYTLDRFQK